MKLEELESMKYGDLLKLAKEKLNITRRLAKEKLIEKLLQQHQNFLSDSNFISADESTGNSTMESEVMEEPIQKRGRKRGNQPEQKQPARASKKAKKESVEHTLNSTFSVDEDERDPEANKDLPVVTSVKPKEPRKMRGRKKAYLTEESSANESENEKPPVVVSKEKTEQPSVTAPEIPAAPLEEAVSQPAPVEKTKAKKKKKKLSAHKVTEAIPIATEPEPIAVQSAEPEVLPVVVNEPPKIAPARKLKKSTSAAEKPTEPEKIAPARKLKKSVSAAEKPANEPEKLPVKRTRSSSGKTSPVAAEQIPVLKKTRTSFGKSAEPEELPVNKKLLASKRNSNGSPAGSPKEADKNVPSPVDKKVALLRTSSHPLRSRKSIVSTPAKTVAVTPAASAKKGVQFTAATNATNIPKLTKPKAAPNFAEIHQKNFLKMQSVDEYVEKKRARTETMTASAKTVRTKSVLNPTTPQTAKPAVAKSQTPDAVAKDMKFNFVSGLQKPVFTAKGQVVNGKQRVMATVKENLHNASQISAVQTATTTAAKGKRKASMLNVSREINASKLSLAGKQILKGVRTNRRFELQMQHRNTKN